MKSSHELNSKLARSINGRNKGDTAMILNHEDILEILPHRYPMLFGADRIVELEPMKRAGH